MTTFESFLNKAVWNWSKTYAQKAPHWYVVRKQFRDDKLFDEVIAYIRQNGVAEEFYGKLFVYFYHGGFKYWTMGNPIKKTTIINRCAV